MWTFLVLLFIHHCYSSRISSDNFSRYIQVIDLNSSDSEKKKKQSSAWIIIQKKNEMLTVKSPMCVNDCIEMIIEALLVSSIQLNGN